MLRLRRHRLTTVLVVVLSLLFAQMALAGYVCPSRATAEMAAAPGTPCEGMDVAHADPTQAVLCHEHAAASVQHVDPAKLPVPTLALVVQLIVLPVVASTDAHLQWATRAPGLRPPPDPLFLATRRLRV